MSVLPRTICDCCGKPMSNAVAVWDDKGYCTTCYKREFALMSCPECGKGVRAPKGQEPRPCKTCRVRDRLCNRCNKPLPHAALVIDDKAYCFPCSLHYKAPQPCNICGEWSIYLSRNRKHGIDVLACPRCHRQKYFTNCADCGRYRERAGVNGAGKPVCGVCLKRLENDTPFICEECGKASNRHRTKMCSNCYDKGLIYRNFAKQANELSQPWVRVLYLGFAKFYADGERRQSLAVHLVKYLDFFKLIDKRCTQEEEVNLYKLFSLFGNDWGRKNFIARSYFISIGKIPPLDDTEHKEMKNFFKQQKILEQGFGKWFHPLLMAFYKNQQELSRRYRERGWKGKDIRYQQRSIWLSLGTALKFLCFIENKVNKPEDIHQLLLNEFFYLYPGYRASIRAFVKFLSKRRITSRKVKVVKLPSNSISEKAIGGTKYVQLLDECLNPLPGKAKNSLYVLFALLYAQRPKQMNLLLLTDVIEEGDGLYSVMFNKVPVPMDEEVNPVLRQYLAERKLTSRP